MLKLNISHYVKIVQTRLHHHVPLISVAILERKENNISMQILPCYIQSEDKEVTVNKWQKDETRRQILYLVSFLLPGLGIGFLKKLDYKYQTYVKNWGLVFEIN